MSEKPNERHVLDVYMCQMPELDNTGNPSVPARVTGFTVPEGRTRDEVVEDMVKALKPLGYVPR